ncbi:hypothetical protein ACE6H2_005787 [Prunus campanulata]
MYRQLLMQSPEPETQMEITLQTFSGLWNRGMKKKNIDHNDARAHDWWSSLCGSRLIFFHQSFPCSSQHSYRLFFQDVGKVEGDTSSTPTAYEP